MILLRGYTLCCTLFFSETMLQQYAVYDDKYDDHFQTANTVYNATVTSLLHCSMLCLEHMRCLSYFYNSQTKECTLHAKSFRNTVPSQLGKGWKFYLTEDRSGRCSSEDRFIYYRDLDFCYKNYDPLQMNFAFFKQMCGDANAELVKVDTEEKQRYIELISDEFTVPRLCVQGTKTIDSEQRWTFDDGTLMTYFNWKPNPSPVAATGEGGVNLGISVSNNFPWFEIPNGVSDRNCVFICQK